MNQGGSVVPSAKASIAHSPVPAIMSPTAVQAPSFDFSYAIPKIEASPANNDYSPERELKSGSLHLVPCRWSLTGWKYVMVDPAEH